jgi:hypothetical protein
VANDRLLRYSGCGSGGSRTSASASALMSAVETALPPASAAVLPSAAEAALPPASGAAAVQVFGAAALCVGDIARLAASEAALELPIAPASPSVGEVVRSTPLCAPGPVLTAHGAGWCAVRVPLRLLMDIAAAEAARVGSRTAVGLVCPQRAPAYCACWRL